MLLRRAPWTPSPRGQVGSEDFAMLLFQKRFHAGLVDGSIRLTFRRWEKPHVRPGGRYRCHPIGVLEVDRVERVPVQAITEEEARAAGFSSRDDLLKFMSEGPAGPVAPDMEVWRVALHHAGDGDRVEIALDDHLSPEDVEALARRLERLGAWTIPTLRLIGRRPRIAASRLAASRRTSSAAKPNNSAAAAFHTRMSPAGPATITASAACSTISRG